VVENRVDGVIVVDAFGRVADLDGAGAGVPCGTPGELVRRSLSDLLPIRAAIGTEGLRPPVPDRRT